jgi:hypothetical protein
MTTAVGPYDPEAGAWRWQIKLADLIVWVLAAGVSAGVARGARDIWGTRVVPGGSNPRVPLERTSGLVLEVTAVFLALILVRAVIRRLRAGRSGAARRLDSRIGQITWRVGAIALLLAFVVEESSLLRIDFSTESAINAHYPGFGSLYRVRQGLLPVCGLLAMIGLALGMGAGALFDEPVPRRGRPYWLFVPLAALVGLLIPGSMWQLITYLVLLAMEAVKNALHHNLMTGPTLETRLLRAGLGAAIAALTCLWLALVLASDFERARRQQPWSTTRRVRLLRVGSLLATLAAGAYLAGVAIPAINPWLADGFTHVLVPDVVFTVIIGFFAFALGLPARSVVHPAVPEKPRWLVRVWAVLQPGVLGLVVLSALACLPTSSQFEPGVPSQISRVVDSVQDVQGWLWSLVPEWIVLDLKPWLAPEPLIWILTILALLSLVCELALRPTSGNDDALFDRAFDSPRQAVQIAWLALAFTVLCLVALQTLMIGGLVILQIRLHAADWMMNG